MRLLVVEDYPPLRDSLRRGLQADGYAVDAAGNAAEAEWLLADSSYDAVILDRMLPGDDGVAILRRLRAGGNPVPVLLLTAMDEIADRVAGLDAGADDYLTKPFAVAELLARLRSLIRRRYGAAEPVLCLADLCLDPAAKTVARGETGIALSPREFQLLEYLLRRAGRVVSRSELWEHLYDVVSDSSSNVLDVLIARLRRKLQAGGGPELIHTRRGHGYVADLAP